MEPPRVLELGRFVLDFADYQKTVGWYTEHFGLIPSDVQLLPDGSPLVAFLRLDLGDTPADHHSIAAAQGLWPEYNHSAYEVTDADAVGVEVGGLVLRDQGYRHAWAAWPTSSSGARRSRSPWSGPRSASGRRAWPGTTCATPLSCRSASSGRWHA